MSQYLLRRILYGILVLLGVNLITFALFFVVNTPEDMARMALGGKRVTEEAITQWVADKGYNKPLLFNSEAQGLAQVTDTLYVSQSLPMFLGELGVADDGRNIAREILERAPISLALALPTFMLGLMVNVCVALGLTYFRATILDTTGVVLCVVAMSISGLFYIIAGQFVFAKMLALVPVSGFQGGFDSIRFLLLPVVLGVLAGIGGGARWYRTLFLEEMNKDYVRTARSKGLPERWVLLRHVLSNGLIPIITGSVAVIPSLFMGSLITESFFGIPGLGSYTIEAIQSQDFGVVRAMVFVGSVLYLLGLVLTDVMYTWVDPRVRLG